MTARRLRLSFVLLLSCLIAANACSKKDTYTVEERSYEGLKKLELVSSRSDTGSTSPESPEQAPGPEWIVVDNVSNVAAAVKKERKQATEDGKKLVVYVGAVWCKPCKEFYQASKRGDFGTELSHLRLIKFDFDRHQSPLSRAGYGSQYLPLFVLPDGEGKGTDARFFGSRFKGKAGIEDLKARLLKLASTN